VAGVQSAEIAGVGRAERGGGDELGIHEVAEESEHRCRAVEFPESAAEAGIGDDAVPGLADEGGVDEDLGLGRREAEEELLDELVQQSGRRRHADGKESGSGGRRGSRVSSSSGDKKRSEILCACDVRDG